MRFECSELQETCVASSIDYTSELAKCQRIFYTDFYTEVLRHLSVIQFINFANTQSTYMLHSRFTLHDLDNRDLHDMIWVCI